MKNLLTVVLFIFFNQLHSQSGAAYKQLKDLDNSISNTLQYWSTQSQTHNNEMNRYYEKIRENNRKRFMEIKNLAFQHFVNNRYEDCIDAYKIAENLRFYDHDFEFITGASYWEKYKYTFEKKDIKRSIKLLKLAKKHGNLNAETLLNIIKSQNK